MDVWQGCAARVWSHNRADIAGEYYYPGIKCSSLSVGRCSSRVCTQCIRTNTTNFELYVCSRTIQLYISEDIYPASTRLEARVKQVFLLYFRDLHYVIHHLWHVATATCFGTKVPSSGSNYNKGVSANMHVRPQSAYVGWYIDELV